MVPSSLSSIIIICTTLTRGGDGPVQSELWYYFVHSISWRRGRSRPVRALLITECRRGWSRPIWATCYITYFMLITYAFNWRNPWGPTECISMHSSHYIFSLQVRTMMQVVPCTCDPHFLLVLLKWGLMVWFSVFLTLLQTLVENVYAPSGLYTSSCKISAVYNVCTPVSVAYILL